MKFLPFTALTTAFMGVAILLVAPSCAFVVGPKTLGVHGRVPPTRFTFGSRNCAVFAKSGDLDCRIGIVGGGPAGIAAAWFLEKKGYKDVTILEGDVVGGKCRTVNYTDSSGITNNYELGAEYITYAYDTLFEFMKEVDEEWVEAGGIVTILGDGKVGTKCNRYFEIHWPLFS